MPTQFNQIVRHRRLGLNEVPLLPITCSLILGEGLLQPLDSLCCSRVQIIVPIAYMFTAVNKVKRINCHQDGSN
jgi:hypothetical protein